MAEEGPVLLSTQPASGAQCSRGRAGGFRASGVCQGAAQPRLPGFWAVLQARKQGCTPCADRGQPSRSLPRAVPGVMCTSGNPSLQCPTGNICSWPLPWLSAPLPALPSPVLLHTAVPSNCPSCQLLQCPLCILLPAPLPALPLHLSPKILSAACLPRMGMERCLVALTCWQWLGPTSPEPPLGFDAHLGFIVQETLWLWGHSISCPFLRTQSPLLATHSLFSSMLGWGLRPCIFHPGARGCSLAPVPLPWRAVVARVPREPPSRDGGPAAGSGPGTARRGSAAPARPPSRGSTISCCVAADLPAKSQQGPRARGKVSCLRPLPPLARGTGKASLGALGGCSPAPRPERSAASTSVLSASALPAQG